MTETFDVTLIGSGQVVTYRDKNKKFVTLARKTARVKGWKITVSAHVPSTGNGRFR